MRRYPRVEGGAELGTEPLLRDAYVVLLAREVRAEPGIERGRVADAEGERFLKGAIRLRTRRRRLRQLEPGLRAPLRRGVPGSRGKQRDHRQHDRLDDGDHAITMSVPVLVRVFADLTADLCR
jgi:hypothetical protein